MITLENSNVKAFSFKEASILGGVFKPIPENLRNARLICIDDIVLYYCIITNKVNKADNTWENIKFVRTSEKFIVS